MPEPFAIPAIDAARFICANAVLARVSVVMIAAATASNESGRSAAASSGSVSTTSRAFISTPITPVDAGRTSCS